MSKHPFTQPWLTDLASCFLLYVSFILPLVSHALEAIPKECDLSTYDSILLNENMDQLDEIPDYYAAGPSGTWHTVLYGETVNPRPGIVGHFA